MLFITVVVGIVFLLNIYHRINNLEAKVKELSKNGVAPQKAAIPTPVPAPVSTSGAQTIPSSVLAPTPPRPTAPIPKHEGSTEFAVGSKILTGVGVLALILGVSFFLRYAFDNNLISEGMRIGLGAIFGIIIGIAGHFLQKKYTQYGHTLTGAGLGILYLTSYSAYSFYGMIGMLPAFALLCIITAAGVALALYYDSKPLVGYAFLGAFIIPLLLPLASSVHTLFMYLVVLNLGVLLIARFKIWPEFTLGSLVGSILIFFQWVFGPYTDALFVSTLSYLTIIFFIYFITSLLNFVYRDRDYKGIDGFLVYAIPVGYFLIALTIVHGKENVALLAGLIGLFYIILSLVIRAAFGGVGELKRFSNAMICVAAPFIAAAISLHFEGSTTTILWVIEAVLMVLIGYLLNTSSNRIAGIILLTLSGLKMVLSDLDLVSGSAAIFNSRSATLFFVILAYVIVWKLYNTYISRIPEATADEKRAGTGISAFGVFLGLFVWVTLETTDFMNEWSLYLPAIWMILVVVMLSLGTITKEKIFRVLSYILFFISAGCAFLFLSELPLSHPGFMNMRVGTALLGVGVISYIVWLFKVQKESFPDEERNLAVTLIILANGLVLWAFTLEILSYFSTQARGVQESGALVSIENTKRVALSGFWLVYALAGLGVGIFRKSVAVRYASMILFAVTIFKIFLYDTANLSDVYRFVSFITLGVIMLIAGFAYYRFKSRILQFVSGAEK